MMYSHRDWKRSHTLPGWLELADIHSQGGMDAEIDRLTSTTDRTPFSKAARQASKQARAELVAFLHGASDTIAYWSTRIDGLPRP